MDNNNKIKGEVDPFQKIGNEIGILAVHGFTVTPQSMRPLANAFADEGYTVNLVKLKGHGETPEKLAATTKEDWKASVLEGLNWLQQHTKIQFVIGQSMGGALTLFLAQRESLSGILLINPAINIPEFEKITKEFSPSEYLDGIDSDIKNSNVKEIAYSKIPVSSFQEVINLVKEVRNNVAQITCPVMIFSSVEDHIVPPSNSDWIYSQIRSSEKSLIKLENSFHTASLDNDQKKIINHSIDFISKFSN